jgi:hypothetical protein
VRAYHGSTASTRLEKARTNRTKRREESLEFGPIQRNPPPVSGRSTTSPIIHIVHGAAIVDEAEAPQDLIEEGQMKIRNSAKDECPPSVWTIVSLALRTWAQMVRQFRRWRIHFLLCTTRIPKLYIVYQCLAKR